MPFCTQCGHENPADARFCSHCGRAMPEPPEAAAGGPPTSARPASGQTSTMSFGAVESEAERGEPSELSADEAAAVDALPPGCALLVVQRGPSAGSRFLLDTEEVTAGRHPDSDIFLDDVTVSRRHAVFRRADKGFLVRDVGSLNGTYVNRDRIDEVLLTGGDEVQVGKFRLVYHASQQGFGDSVR